MSTRIKGSFDVKVTPQPPFDTVDGVSLGRMSGDKTFHGDLDATSKVEMLTVGTTVKGSAAYVAIERIVGAVAGRAGSFVVQHSATMTRGAPSLTITVVPDSGTGALAGIAGTMTIDIVDGKHFYTLDYTL